jgi:hypothetical protein
MNRSFYSFAIFFGALHTIIALTQSIIFIKVGPQIYYLESFPFWYISSELIMLLATFLLLKYYYHKNFTFTFWSAVISTLAAFFQFVIVYNLLMGKRESASFYMPAVTLTLATVIVYAISLIFSNAAKRPWLKTAGIVTLILAMVLVSSIIWSQYSGDIIRKNVALESVTKWTSLAFSLVPLAFIMNFFNEQRLTRKETALSPLPPQRTLESMMGFASVIAIAAALFFGVKISNESYWSLHWKNYNAEKAKELAQKCEARTFVGVNGDTLRYLLLKPLDYDLQKKYPLVVSLPYGGYEASAAQWLADDFNRKKYPCFVFVPYCPDGAGWGGIPNYPTLDVLVFDAISTLEKEMSIDEKRRYVTGVSRGGYGSWHFICARPDMFAAAIPVCGEGNPMLAPGIVDVSVWAFHGENDRNVPVSGSRNMIEAMKEAGGDPKYTEFAGTGHNIWDQVKNTPGLLDWLFEQKRN